MDWVLTLIVVIPFAFVALCYFTSRGVRRVAIALAAFLVLVPVGSLVLSAIGDVRESAESGSSDLMRFASVLGSLAIYLALGAFLERRYGSGRDWWVIFAVVSAYVVDVLALLILTPGY